MQVLGIQIGKAERTTVKSGWTGHFKKPVDQAQIAPAGLVGDTICDTKHHGGVDQAVYVFGEPDRQWWSETLGRDTPPGFFGENLLISDLYSADLALGDILTIGEVLLQITSPRIPCATYAAHIGDPQAIKQFYAANRPGAYARVLQAGAITVGTQVERVPWVGDRITIVDNMQAFLTNHADSDLLRRSLNVPAHHKLHELAHSRLSKG